MQEMRSKARQGIRLPDLPGVNPAPFLAVLFVAMIGYGTWTAAGTLANRVEARREGALITARNNLVSLQRWIERVRTGGDRRLFAKSLAISLAGRDLEVRSYLSSGSVLNMKFSFMNMDECRSLGELLNGSLGGRAGTFPQPHSVRVNGKDFMDASSFTAKHCTKDTFFSQKPGEESYGTNVVTIRYPANLSVPTGVSPEIVPSSRGSSGTAR